MQDDHEPFQMYAGYLLLYMHPCRSTDEQRVDLV